MTQLGRRRTLAALLLAAAALTLACGDDADDGTVEDAAATSTAVTTPSPTPSPAAAGDEDGAAEGARGAGGAQSAAPLTLTSPAFAEGEPIPVLYGCDGANISPPLAIGGIPAGAAALALVLDDPDAPSGTWDHWVRWNLPPLDAIEEVASAWEQPGELATAGVNSWGKLDYGGPCPPSGTHRYVFTLYALDGELDLAEGATTADLAAAMAGRTLALAELTGTYDREQARLPPAGGFPPTPLLANLTEAYKVADGQAVPFAVDPIPVRPGAVQAQWYQSLGRYVVVYLGWAIEETGSLCPGNSIQTASGFLHVSNAATAGGTCEGATTLAGPDVGIRECGDLVVYVTAIPSDLGGNVFGTIERFEADGSIIGLTSVVAAEPSAAPAVDLDALCGS